MTLDLLLVAPWCDGDDIGEAWVGYQWVRRLAARHRVTLLSYYKRDRVPPSVQIPDARVVEWPDLPLVGRAERMNSLMKPGYFSFYLRSRRWIRAAQARGEHFDLAHQLLPVAMRYPSPLANQPVPVSHRAGRRRARRPAGIRRRRRHRPVVHEPPRPRPVAAALRSHDAQDLRARTLRVGDRPLCRGRPRRAAGPALRGDERDRDRRPARAGRSGRSRGAGPAPLRRADRPHQGPARCHPRAGAPPDLHPGRLRRRWGTGSIARRARRSPASSASTTSCTFTATRTGR